MSATEARAVLRALLRAVDRNVTSASGNRQWREFVLAQWRANAASSNEAERSAALQEAKDYALLIDSIREHKVSDSLSTGEAQRTWEECATAAAATAAAAAAACTLPHLRNTWTFKPIHSARAGAAAVLQHRHPNRRP